jgi:hypothetical protein
MTLQKDQDPGWWRRPWSSKRSTIILVVCVVLVVIAIIVALALKVRLF